MDPTNFIDVFILTLTVETRVPTATSIPAPWFNVADIFCTFVIFLAAVVVVICKWEFACYPIIIFART